MGDYLSQYFSHLMKMFFLVFLLFVLVLSTFFFLLFISTNIFLVFKDVLAAGDSTEEKINVESSHIPLVGPV